MNSQKETAITFSFLVRVLKKAILWMLIVAVVCGAAYAGYNFIFVDDVYTATATFWVNNTSSNYDYTSTAQTAAAIEIATQCVEFATAEKPVRRAVEAGDLLSVLADAGYSFADENAVVNFVKRSSFAGKKAEDSVIFYVTVRTSDPTVTYEIIRAVEDTLPGVVIEQYGLYDNPKSTKLVTVIDSVYDVSCVKKVSRGWSKIALISAAVGAVATYAVFFFGILLKEENEEEKKDGAVA